MHKVCGLESVNVGGRKLLDDSVILGQRGSV